MAETIVDSYGKYTPLPNGSQVPGVTAVEGEIVLHASGNPNSLGIVAVPGQLFFNTDGSNGLWETTNGTTWTLVTSGGGGSTQVYLVTGNPNGVVTATAPAIGQSVAGDLWIKPTGSGNTGWIQLIAA